MAKLEDYLYVPIKNKKLDLMSKFKSNLKLIYHSLLPHSQPVEPKSKITPEAIEKSDIDVIYESSLEIYKDSKDRIKSLESKAFNLMSYISAITAILIFLLSQEINIITKSIAITLMLILALLISLRCIGIKVQKNLFINSMFDFKEENIKTNNKAYISAELINNALFNQNVADNTTDILKASRILLVYGIILSSISFLTFSFTDNNLKKINKTDILNTKYIDSIYSNYKSIKESELIKISKKMDSLSMKIDSVKLNKKNK